MNWLLYIGGGMATFILINSILLVRGGNQCDKNADTVIKLIIWLCLWVWFCWKFIA